MAKLKMLTRWPTRIAATGILLGYLIGCGFQPQSEKEIQRLQKIIANSNLDNLLIAGVRDSMGHSEEQARVIVVIEKKMPKIQGYGFKCWFDTNSPAGEPIFEGMYFSGLSVVGIMVGGTNWVVATNEWPRYSFKRYRDGAFLFYSAN